MKSVAVDFFMNFAFVGKMPQKKHYYKLTKLYGYEFFFLFFKILILYATIMEPKLKWTRIIASIYINREIKKTSV